jgi:FkbH-like protein
MLSRKILAALVTIAMIVVPMVSSAAAIAGLVHWSNATNPWGWLRWGISLPFLYLGWLAGFLGLSALLSRELGKRWPKPRRVVFGQGVPMAARDVFGLMTVGSCYQGFNVVHALPLARVFGALVLRAYSPSVHIGQWVRNWGYLYDPDLIDIGDRVTIGGRALVVAHTVTVRPDGASVYVSAPVKINRRATVGGNSLVSLGCVIGEDAIVESGSVIAPFTQIPPGEVWGGNPACFRRKRDEAGDGAVPGTPARVSIAPVAATTAQVTRAAADHTPVDSIQRLVADALALSPDGVTDDLSSDTCSAWDSLGQVAIAAAIYDRHGITVGPSEVFRLRTLRDIADLIDGRARTPGAAVIVESPISPPSPAPEIPEVRPQQMSNRLPRDIEMLPLLDVHEASRALAENAAQAPTAGATLSVLIAATFTAEAIAPPLKLWARAFGLTVECRFAGFDQVVQTLLADNRRDESERGSVTVVLARPEDLASGSEESAIARVDQMLEAIRAGASRSSGGRLLAGTLPPVVSSFTSVDRRQVESLRSRYRGGLEAIAGIEIFDFAEVVERVGIEQARSSQSEALTRGPYSPSLYQRLAIALVRQIRSRLGSPAKVIAVDCDNTLWGGVVGEVGLDGLELGSDGPGRSFQLFQRYLKRLKDRGTLLVVVSRNEERDVREVFAKHPEMVLGLDDIAAWRVNWRHKSDNLRELADELNLGLDSFVFLDDDPAVRLEVETRVPDVHVVPLPVSPAEYCETLSRLWLFDGTQPTAVDTGRTRMMQDEQRRQQLSGSAPTLDAFLAGLELRAEMRVASDRDWPRVAQLTQRTNQFNLSLKRRTLEALKALEPESLVLVLEAADRFGDYGLVGVCILTARPHDRVSEVDTFLMSCRALGRGVEDAFLHGVAVVAAERGAAELVAPYVTGPRNKQITEFLARTGFEERPHSLWARSLREMPPLARHVRFGRDGGKPQVAEIPPTRQEVSTSLISHS